MRGKWLLLILLLNSCGLPDTPDIPARPISTDKDSSTDNQLAFKTPADSKIDRYVIWYKIYPYITLTNTDSLVDADKKYFEDAGVLTSSDIRKKDFHELQLGSSEDSGYYFRNIPQNTELTIARNPADRARYIDVSVAGGQTYSVRRNVPVSASDNTRKSFYGQFYLEGDTDIKSRKSSDFSAYGLGTLNEGFAVAFMAQSAYINAASLKIVSSSLVYVGTIYSANGFVNL